MKLTAILCGFAFLSTMLIAQQQTQSAKGQISGIIFRNGSDEPIVNARVTLTRVNPTTGAPIPTSPLIANSVSSSGPPPAPPLDRIGAAGPLPPPPPAAIPAVYTDRGGKFVIPDLEPGGYRLSVFAADYVRQEYGQRVFPGQGTLLTLTSGQVMKDLVLRLNQTGTVTGRVRDNMGQPAVGVNVQLLKSAYNGIGQKILQSAGSTSTNDRGEYRLYWITPGRYYVAVGDSIPGLSVQRATASEGYMFTYYPGVADLGAATTVDVTSGNELALDFLVSRQEVFLVRGRVVDSVTNRPPPSISTQLSYSMIGGGGGTYVMNLPYDANTGAFEIRDVSPGAFTLQITAQGRVARMPLNVASNIDGLSLVLSGVFSIPGRLSMDGQIGATGFERARVLLRPTGSSILAPNAPAVAADGTFRFENIPAGEYRVSISTTQGGPDYFIKEARFDRNDVLSQPLVLSSSLSGEASLEITISPNVASVEGTVTDQKLQPMPGVQAVLVPDQRDRTELFKAVTTDQTGHFSIRAITPGDYKLFAWEALENNAYFDPELIKQVEKQGKPIHIGESSKADVELRSIPASK
jgi:hypothetical protein